MPLKLNVGVSKKVGLPQFGSLGTSCYVELELDSHLLSAHPEAFQQQVQDAYTACSQAVEDELARHQAAATDSENELPETPPLVASDGNGQGGRNNGRGASQRQMEYAQQLAGKTPGVGVRRLELLTHELFDKPLSELSCSDASTLIDTLKAIKAGKVELGEVLEGASA